MSEPRQDELRRDIERDAALYGHTLGPWIEDDEGAYVACAKCGDDATVRGGRVVRTRLHYRCGEDE